MFQNLCDLASVNSNRRIVSLRVAVSKVLPIVLVLLELLRSLDGNPGGPARPTPSAVSQLLAIPELLQVPQVGAGRQRAGAGAWSCAPR